MYSTKMPATNIHTHIFTADHLPPIQFYYMLRALIAEKFSRSLSYIDVIHKRFIWVLLKVFQIILFVIKLIFGAGRL